nr:unnamed protein product [Digitaria exilis]
MLVDLKKQRAELPVAEDEREAELPMLPRELLHRPDPELAMVARLRCCGGAALPVLAVVPQRFHWLSELRAVVGA